MYGSEILMEESVILLQWPQLPAAEIIQILLTERQEVQNIPLFCHLELS